MDGFLVNGMKTDSQTVEFYEDGELIHKNSLNKDGSVKEWLNEKEYQSPFLDKRERLFENEVGFVIYDGFPVSKGHCLVVPKRVYPDYFDSTPEELKGLNELIFKTKEFLDKKYKPTGYNIGVNSGEDSGQTVFHLHIHLIPRYKGDVDDPRGGVWGNSI